MLRSLPGQPFLVELAPDDERAGGTETDGQSAPLGWYRIHDWLRNHLHAACLDLVNVEIGSHGVRRSALPSPHVDPPSLRDRSVRESDPETSYSGAIVKMGPVSELQRVAQEIGRHARAVVEDADAFHASAPSFSDLNHLLVADQLDDGCGGLHRIVDQLGERICRVAISAVAHRLDGEFRRDDVAVLRKLPRSDRHCPTRPPNSRKRPRRFRSPADQYPPPSRSRPSRFRPLPDPGWPFPPSGCTGRAIWSVWRSRPRSCWARRIRS